MDLQFPSLDAAIAKQEGFGKTGTSATNTNNPGAIAYSPWSAQHGGAPTIGSDIATFATVEQGTAAEDALIAHYAAQGATIQDLTNAWAPASIPGNDPIGYAKNLAAATGTSPTTPLTQLAGQPDLTGAAPGSPSDLWGRVFGSGPVDIQKDLNSIAGGVTNSILGFSLSRVAAFFLGLICIAGAIFLFKPTQTIAINAARAAAL